MTPKFRLTLLMAAARQRRTDRPIYVTAHGNIDARRAMRILGWWSR